MIFFGMEMTSPSGFGYIPKTHPIWRATASLGMLLLLLPPDRSVWRDADLSPPSPPGSGINLSTDLLIHLLVNLLVHIQNAVGAPSSSQCIRTKNLD